MERKVCTIGEWLDVWYEVYAVPEYASKTLEIYRDARKRLSRRFPEIESTLLTELLPVTFQKAFYGISSRFITWPTKPRLRITSVRKTRSMVSPSPKKPRKKSSTGYHTKNSKRLKKLQSNSRFEISSFCKPFF